MVDNEINIKYNVKNKAKININLFGEIFVKNNKNLCKIRFKNKEYELRKSIRMNNPENKEIFEIT